MTFLNAAAAVFFATLPIILGLYILRLKRREVTVSTTLFWRQVLEDVEANTPFQRLRYSHLLILQMLIASLLVLALMQPAQSRPSTRGVDTVLLIDVSASMAAEDGSPTRLDAVKKQLTELIEAKGKRDKLALVAGGSNPVVLASLTEDPAILTRAVSQLAIEPGPGNLATGADLALSLIDESARKEAELLARAGTPPPTAPPPPSASDPEGPPQAQVVIFSDDPLALPAPPESALRIKWSQQPVGFQDTENAAIVMADLLNPDAETGTMSLFLTTFFQGNGDAEAELTVKQGTTLLDLRTLTLRAGTEESHVFDGVPLVAGRYELQLRVTGAAPGADGSSDDEALDQLPLDNTAYLVFEPQAEFTVLVLSSNELYGRILTLLPDVRVFARALSGGIPGGEYDLILVDGDLPLNAPPGTYLVIKSNNHELLPVEITDEASGAKVSDWKATDPLLRFVNPQTFRMTKLNAVAPKDWGRVVLDTDKGPAIVYGERGQHRIVYWSFDPFQTELPRTGTFPILLASHVDFFKAKRGMQTLTTKDLIQLPAGNASVILTHPDGQRETIALDPSEDFNFAPDALGYWQAELEGPEGAVTRDFGVNLFDPDESLLPAGETFEGGAIAKFEHQGQALQSWWRWIALGLVVFLLAEWWIYHQRIF